MIFVGVASEGATETGPALRGRALPGRCGSCRLGVATGVVARVDGTRTVSSVSVIAAAGERWRMYATGRADGSLEASVCAGSAKLGPAEDGAAAPPPVERGDVKASTVATRGVLLPAASRWFSSVASSGCSLT